MDENLSKQVAENLTNGISAVAGDVETDKLAIDQLTKVGY